MIENWQPTEILQISEYCSRANYYLLKQGRLHSGKKTTLVHGVVAAHTQCLLQSTQSAIPCMCQRYVKSFQCYHGK